MPVNPMPQPQSPPQPTPTFRVLEAGDIQGQLEDTRTWLSRRLKLRQDLESFGNPERWLQHKPCLTPSEAKILQVIHKEQEPQLRAQQITIRATKVSSRGLLSPDEDTEGVGSMLSCHSLIGSGDYLYHFTEEQAVLEGRCTGY